MLDLVFLQKENIQLRKSIVYEYSTAIFKTKVYHKIRDFLSLKGIQVREIDYNNVTYSLNETSLFGEFLVLIDLDKLHKDKKYKEYLTEIADLIKVKALNNRFLFYLRKTTSYYETFSKLPQISIISKASMVLTELDLSKQTFDKIFDFITLDYLNIIPLKSLENYTMFRTSIEDYVINNKPNISEFFSNFDIFIFTCINFKTNLFDPQTFRSLLSSKEKVNFFRLHKLIFDFIMQPSGTTSNKIITELDKEVNKRFTPTKVIISNLFKITRDFLFINNTLNPMKQPPEGMSQYRWKQLTPFELISTQKLLKWQITLSRYEPLFNTKNLLLELQSFLSEFY